MSSLVCLVATLTRECPGMPQHGRKQGGELTSSELDPAHPVSTLYTYHFTTALCQVRTPFEMFSHLPIVYCRLPGLQLCVRWLPNQWLLPSTSLLSSRPFIPVASWRSHGHVTFSMSQITLFHPFSHTHFLHIPNLKSEHISKSAAWQYHFLPQWYSF